MALSVEQAIARVPQWVSATDIKSAPLGGGITNNNFRIDVGGESFVLRIPGADTDLLGIDRQNEYQANSAAGKLGIAPQVYYFIQPEGYLVTRFITARPILPDEISQPQNIQKVANLLQKIHSMARIQGVFNVFQVVREYSAVAQRCQVNFPQSYEWLIGRVQEAEHALSLQPTDLRPCHNDLLNANFLAGDRLYLLDWEYAGMGDIFFDLGNFSDHHELTEQQQRWLLSCYFDREPTPAEWAHLQIMKLMSELREASWGLVQIGISRLEFDFHAYVDQFFGRAMKNIANPKWNDYLQEVIKNV